MSGFVPDSRFKTEEEFAEHFRSRVAPLRNKIRTMAVGAIPENELARAILVYVHGAEETLYYRRRLQMNSYDKEQLDKYVDRQHL